MKTKFFLSLLFILGMSFPIMSTVSSCSSDDEDEQKFTEEGTINGYGWVDLGLSVKWATCNVGASSPEEYGSYCAWGETAAKSEYTEENSLTYGKSMSDLFSAGIIGLWVNLTIQHDVARANWGGSWRPPTEAEYEELIDGCTWTWTTQGGHNGYKVTGPSGKSIFLPAAGWYDGTSLDGVGEYGDYWSSAPVKKGSDYAYGLGFNGDRHDVYWTSATTDARSALSQNKA